MARFSKKIAIPLAIVPTFALLMSASGNVAQASSSSTPVDGGTLTIGQALAFDSALLPYESGSGYTISITNMTYATLLTNDAHLNFLPWLATSWKFSNGNKTLTMTLQKGAKWSDGKPITSDDVLFALDTLASPDYTKYVQGPMSYYAASIVGYNDIESGKAKSFAQTGGFKKINNYKFQINFSVVDAAVLWSDIANIQPLPKHYLENVPIKDWMNSKVSEFPAVTSGPYEYSQVNGKSSVVLAANPYFFKGKPHISKVVFQTVSQDTAPGLIANGSIDMYTGFKPTDLPKLKQIPNISLHTYASLNYSFIGLKLYQPEFQDVRVRQAFEYAMNRPAMIKAITGGLGKLVEGPVSTVSWAAATPKDGMNPYPYDPAKANQLLDAAGWTKQKNGWRIDPVTHKTADIKMLYDAGDPTTQTEVVAIQQFLGKVGVKVTLEAPLEWTSFVTKILSKDKDVQMFVVSFGPNLDPDPRQMWMSTATFNVDDWSDKKNEALIAKTWDGAAFNKAVRKAALVKWQLYVNQQLPQLFLWQNSGVTATNTRVHIPAKDWGVYGAFNPEDWWIS